MDFFQHQEEARKKTTQMVILFALAVIAIVASLNAVFAGFYLYAMDTTTAGMQTSVDRFQNVPLSVQLKTVPMELWFGVTIITLFVIMGGSIFKVSQLNDGGEAVAAMVGARKVSRNTSDRQEKQLLNIVDEMAIASGITVPQVFVMDGEPGINAFAAGYKANEAVVAVTRGTLDQLERDELQGVIAHEFSHIFNGDMRLNIRLMGVLYGILVIGGIGGYMLRSIRYSSHRSRDGKGAGAMLAIGLALLIIGFAGVFFGRLIKAGVSRQREFLADSSAVQFTRNPEGITDALKKIGKLDEGSLIQGRGAEELSHMFFSQGITTALSSMMATHPPLMDRIKRINKGRVPPLSEAKRRKAQRQASAEQAADLAAQTGSKPDSSVASDLGAGGISAGSITESIGNPGNLHMIYAAALLASIPQPVSDALALQKGSTALMFALVLDDDDKIRQQELKIFRATPFSDLESEVMRLAGELDKLHARYRLPLFDLAVPTLLELNTAERQSLLQAVKQVIDADRIIKLEELTIYVLLKAHIGTQAGRADKVRYKSLSTLKNEISLLLSLLAYLGKSEQISPQDVFEKAADELDALLPDLKLISVKDFDPSDFEAAMEKFREMSPILKEKVTAACIAAVLADDDVNTKELEVMRGVCASMEVPIPPVLVEEN